MVKSNNLTVNDLKPEFEKLWDQYPKYRKQGKQRAFSSYTHWRKSSKDNTFEKAQDQLNKYLNHIKVQHVPTQFIKAAKTWFANIDDEYDQAPKQANSFGRQKSVERLPDFMKNPKKEKIPKNTKFTEEEGKKISKWFGDNFKNNSHQSESERDTDEDNQA